MKEGMLILGCVKEVTDFEVTVSLPCGLQGFLSIKNICESYAKQLSKQLEADDSEVGPHVDAVRTMCAVIQFWFFSILNK